MTGNASVAQGAAAATAGTAANQADTPSQPRLSPREMETLRANDKEATTAIVGILATILLLALAGYITIALLASQGPS